MKKLILFLIKLSVLLIFQPAIISAQSSASVNYAFINGNWFNGKKFEKRIFYTRDGFFTQTRPPRIDQTIDLANGFVVPPFADAHTHNFDSNFNINQQIAAFLKDGVFYAKVQTDVRSSAVKVADKVNLPTSLDASYAHGALTHTYGHGIEVYEALALGFYGDLKVYESQIPLIAKSRLRDNDAYYIIDTAADLEKKWQKILDGKPDFIKIYLLTSEDFSEKLRRIPNIPLGSIGLDPALVPIIVEKAHKAGLRVSAHVDTVTDFRIALKAGVDEMAHIPGYYIGLDDNPVKYQLTENDAREAARRKIWIIPAPIAYTGIDPRVRALIDSVLKPNLTLLKKYKVNIALGSDHYGSTPLEDVLYFNKLGVYNNLETLKIWCENTPHTIFPNRKIGFLREGFEASFLVLNENPIENFANVKSIRLRFKQGFLLD